MRKILTFVLLCISFTLFGQNWEGNNSTARIQAKGKNVVAQDTSTTRYLYMIPQTYYPYNPSKDMLINYKDTFKIYTGSVWKLFNSGGGGTGGTANYLKNHNLTDTAISIYSNNSNIPFYLKKGASSQYGIYIDDFNTGYYPSLQLTSEAGSHAQPLSITNNGDQHAMDIYNYSNIGISVSSNSFNSTSYYAGGSTGGTGYLVNTNTNGTGFNCFIGGAYSTGIKIYDVNNAKSIGANIEMDALWSIPMKLTSDVQGSDTIAWLSGGYSYPNNFIFHKTGILTMNNDSFATQAYVRTHGGGGGGTVDTTKTPFPGHLATQWDLSKKLNISNYQSDTTTANRKIETYTQFKKDTVQAAIPGIVSIHDFSVWNAKINLSNLSGTSPITYNNTTGAIGINTANTSTTGALTSTDWNTFNGKYSGLPSQTGNSGKVLTTNGTIESWGTVSSMVYPADTGIVHMSSANTYGQSYNASHKIPLVDIPSLPESQVTNLITDLGSKLNVIDTVKRVKLMTRKATDSLYQVKGSYLTANQTITLGGILSGSGSTSITASAASGYYMPSTGDQTNWNAKLSSYTETDPIFIADSSIYLSKNKYHADSAVLWLSKANANSRFATITNLNLKVNIGDSLKNAPGGYQTITSAKLKVNISDSLQNKKGGYETVTDISNRFSKSNFGTYISGNGTTIVSSLYNGYQKFTGSGTITGWSIQEGSSSPVSSTTAVSLYTGSTPAYSSLSSILTMNLSSASNASATGLSIAFTAGQYYIFNVTSNSAAQYLTIQIYYTK